METLKKWAPPRQVIFKCPSRVVATLGSCFVSCTAIGKNLGVRSPLFTFIEESLREVALWSIPREAIYHMYSIKVIRIQPMDPVLNLGAKHRST